MPGYLGRLGHFKEKFDKPISLGELKKMSLLKDLIKPFILRRLKIDVLKELPDKIENKMVVDLSEEQKQVYVGYLDQVRNELRETYNDSGFAKNQIKTLAALTRLRQICLDPGLFIEDFSGACAKVELLKELLEELIEGQHKVLIFSQFTSMLEKIENMLKEYGYEYYKITGQTPALLRNEMVDQFNDDQTPIFLISLKAGGTGLNLTGADTVIHFDPWWNPAVEDQATDRAYRIGQTKKVHVMKLVTRGTIEEKIYALQDKKKDLIESVIQPGETMINKLTEDEIMALLE
jgi:SNF2 family DNA or RNA helicase